MNLRQCLHSMHSKRASSYLTILYSLWPWAGLLLHWSHSVYLESLLYLFLCNCFPNCLIKYDYEEEEEKEEGRAAEFPCSNFLQLFFQRHVPLSLSHTSGLDTPMGLLPKCRAPFSAFLMPACGHHCEAHDKSLWMISLYIWWQRKLGEFSLPYQLIYFFWFHITTRVLWYG